MDVCVCVCVCVCCVCACKRGYLPVQYASNGHGTSVIDSTFDELLRYVVHVQKRTAIVLWQAAAEIVADSLEVTTDVDHDTPPAAPSNDGGA